MKFSKKQDCAHCELKCDIYSTLLHTDQASEYNAPVHAQLKKHDVICKQGTEVSHALFLTKGSAKLYIEGLNNRNIILYILKPPAYIGLLSFFESPRYSYSVSALEASEICLIELDLVKKLYIENHDLLLCLNKAFGKSVAMIMQKIISLNQKQIRGRIAENLLYLADIHQSTTFHVQLTRKEIGEMAAISEENTVRLLTEFSRENIIATNGRTIEILDMSLLKKISEVG
ncbi:MAG: Crp/Fnr family transcriptional regulator [Bacteroidetes bacterium]|nr:Crp/Fnr family transcriptional regulator [Bacteroidota bacterium]MBU1578772.1 Crp/Fnr family transcriptional regulator [Bacteroidota bacterium]MBU2466881.1 Crp/Fnr family transcriptional regulator [Bacteroidota bacterium]MBU2558563.1 Crp/Fnr family transcriptional regulator [Bacteroidota bacterium]